MPKKCGYVVLSTVVPLIEKYIIIFFNQRSYAVGSYDKLQKLTVACNCRIHATAGVTLP